MSAFYNECDPYAAQWLRNLIAAGHIAPGVVDERDIRDIRPEELFDYDQCHFFAGVGIWPYALRRAGWADDRPIWTGSCPCQPFSAAGRAGGFADERHLWPHWHHLIRECRPPVVAGEQVASKDGLGWLDLVSADMEGTGYAFGASDLCAAGITVEWQVSQAGEWLQRAIHDCADPLIATMLRDFADWAGAGNLGDGGEHIRQRLYFVGVADASCSRVRDQECRSDGGSSRGNEGEAGEQRVRNDGRDDRRFSSNRMADDDDERCQRRRSGEASHGRDPSWLESERLRDADRLDHSHDEGSQGHTGHGGNPLGHGRASERSAAATGVSDGLADHPVSGRRELRSDLGGRPERSRSEELEQRPGSGSLLSGHETTDAAHRERRPVDRLFCRDGKWRSVESGTFPLAHAAPARVGRLRAYGNALDGETATEFIVTIKAILDGEPDAALGGLGCLEFEDLIG
jgi:DNA (cytosine-5)-methyltransferase 1